MIKIISENTIIPKIIIESQKNLKKNMIWNKTISKKLEKKHDLEQDNLKKT